MLSDDWHAIVDALGMTVLDVRTLLGWSQQQLADQAVVSQGLVSRLERGLCDSVPFHSVVVVLRTLATGAAAMDLPLSPTAAQLLAFAPALNGGFVAVTPPDADLAFIAQAIRRIPRPQRPAFRAIIRAVAAALGDDEP